MKLFFLAPANSIHTKRWVIALAERGYIIYLFSLIDTDDWYKMYPNITVYSCGINEASYLISKVKYLSVVNAIRRKVKEFKPDILHAHYASSYGLLGSLVGFHPYIISVWGSDVYEFPRSNAIFKRIIEYNFKCADYILSTSSVMAKETKKYTDKEIYVTPFGVDTNLFCRTLSSCKSESELVIGNVKTLSPKYGIDILIRAFKLIRERNATINPVLVIVGDGPNKNDYVKLAADLGLKDKVKFIGKVPNKLLPEYYNSFYVSVSVSVSDSESFGVVAVEAMACECPVVVSNADGFTEVVEDGVTGIIVPKKNVDATADAIQKLIDNRPLRDKMGRNGRERVLRLYQWKNNVDTMEDIYREVISENKK